jgi:hypothetical protein
MKKFVITCEFSVRWRRKISHWLLCAKIFLRTAAASTKISGDYPAEIKAIAGLFTESTDPAATVI